MKISFYSFLNAHAERCVSYGIYEGELALHNNNFFKLILCENEMSNANNQQERLEKRRNIEKILKPKLGEIFTPCFGAMRYANRTEEIIEHNPEYRKRHLLTAATFAIAHGLMIITPTYAIFKYLTE